MANEIWVFSEKTSLQAELLACAKGLAGVLGASTTAVVLGDQAAVDGAFAQGAGKVYWLGEKTGGQLVEDYVPTLAALLEEHKPAALLVGSTRRGKVVAGRLGATLGLAVLADVKEMTVQAGAIQASHMIFAGAALRVEKALTATLLATMGPGVAEALPPDAVFVSFAYVDENRRKIRISGPAQRVRDLLRDISREV